MKIFIGEQDLNQLDSDDLAFQVIRRHLLSMADLYPENGYLILVEKTDMGEPIVLPERTINLASVFWEGVTKRNGHYHAVLLLDSEYALEFLLPDTTWLEEAIRKNLKEHM
jgi:hypothetical protein